MKILATLIMCVGLFSRISAQDLQTNFDSKFRLSFTYGISAINPAEINDKIAESNAALGATAKSIKWMPELAGSVTIRPADDFKIIILRAGYMNTERQFSFSVPETQTSSTSTGVTQGSLTETYTAYPFSIGVGGTTEKGDMQLQMEFIYALGYVSEEGSYTSSTGKKTAFTRSEFSPTYGFRVDVSMIAPITPMIGLQFDFGYRYLRFDEFEDEVTAQPSPIEFSMSGIQGSLGLSIRL